MEQLITGTLRSRQRLNLISTVYCYAIAKLFPGIYNFRQG